MLLTTYEAFRDAVNRLPRIRVPDALVRVDKPHPDADPAELYVKLVDAQILWSMVTTPPVIELLTDLDETLASSSGPYAKLEAIQQALTDYRARVGHWSQGRTRAAVSEDVSSEK